MHSSTNQNNVTYFISDRCGSISVSRMSIVVGIDAKIREVIVGRNRSLKGKLDKKEIKQPRAHDAFGNKRHIINLAKSNHRRLIPTSVEI